MCQYNSHTLEFNVLGNKIIKLPQLIFCDSDYLYD